jgi:hypothetical protein
MSRKLDIAMRVQLAPDLTIGDALDEAQRLSRDVERALELLDRVRWALQSAEDTDQYALNDLKDAIRILAPQLEQPDSTPILL